LKRIGTFTSFKNLLKNNNEKLELLNSFQKFIFDKQSAPRGPSPPLATPLATVRYHYQGIHLWAIFQPLILSPALRWFHHCKIKWRLLGTTHWWGHSLANSPKLCFNVRITRSLQFNQIQRKANSCRFAMNATVA